jgi:hypothetical protein
MNGSTDRHNEATTQRNFYDVNGKAYTRSMLIDCANECLRTENMITISNNDIRGKHIVILI